MEWYCWAGILFIYNLGVYNHTRNKLEWYSCIFWPVRYIVFQVLFVVYIIFCLDEDYEVNYWDWG